MKSDRRESVMKVKNSEFVSKIDLSITIVNSGAGMIERNDLQPEGQRHRNVHFLSLSRPICSQLFEFMNISNFGKRDSVYRPFQSQFERIF
jgi:hypothetical protein